MLCEKIFVCPVCTQTQAYIPAMVIHSCSQGKQWERERERVSFLSFLRGVLHTTATQCNKITSRLCQAYVLTSNAVSVQQEADGNVIRIDSQYINYARVV